MLTIICTWYLGHKLGTNIDNIAELGTTNQWKALKLSLRLEWCKDTQQF